MKYDMTKKLILAFAAILCTLGLSAQTYTGGIKGTVINRSNRQPVADATLVLMQGLEEIASVTSDGAGDFLIPDLADGMYDLVITAPDFIETRVNVTVNDGYVKNMFNLSLTPSQVVTEVDVDNLVEFDLDDSGYSDNPTVLFGQNDVFNEIAGFNFSDIRFRVRGYSSESQDVYLAGVRMNDAITGYSPFSLWSGLNEATRTKNTVNGAEIADWGIGGYNGLTNLPVNATSVRKGLRGSILTNSALYRLRLMMTYASGQLDNGWAYAISASARLGGNDWVKGQYYRSFGYYAAVEKQFGDAHRLGLVFMATPGNRGKQNSSTQEVYDLMGDNMYNSNWGYQNGKMRNSRLAITHEPIAILKYDFTPTYKFNASATVLYRFGKNGATALDWYDAPDPRPDYYRNLPSYFWNDDEEYNRLNMSKAMWARDAWENNDTQVTQVNWDRMYNVNKLNIVEGQRRSKYAVEERRADQHDLNFATSFKWRPDRDIILTGGWNAKFNRTEHFKVLYDLLGGDYFLDVDSFADRDFSANPYMTQNDLGYWMEHGEARKVRSGEKYGYDYYAQVRKTEAWFSARAEAKGFEAAIGGRLGYTAFWREGLVRKGLFPGLNDNGSAFLVDGVPVTNYDGDGKPVTSYGKSAVQDFITGAVKGNLAYVIRGGHRFYFDAGYFSDAPTFNQTFMSPRTRNTVIPDVKNVQTFTTDLNYQYSNNGYNVRLTGYWTYIKDQSDVMSFYDDSQHSFTNLAMTGINQRHIGMELGVRVPTPIPDLSVEGVLSYGNFVYTSNPVMYQTIDNNASVVADTYGVKIPYWKSHPTADGKTVRHYVPSTPQLASSLGLSWNHNYWFIDLAAQYFDKAYLDMNPVYRTDMATAGNDGIVTPAEVEYMAAQEKFDPAFMMNASIGKSWYIQRTYQIGFSLNAKNLLNNRDIRTGGYESTRLVSNTKSKERYFRFDPKYFYMSGFNYMLNIYFRF